MRLRCGVELVDRKAKANEVRWYGQVIRRDDTNILKKVMMMEVNGKRKRGRPKMTWRRQVEECVRAIAEGMRCIRPPSGTRKKPD